MLAVYYSQKLNKGVYHPPLIRGGMGDPITSLSWQQVEMPFQGPCPQHA